MKSKFYLLLIEISNKDPNLLFYNKIILNLKKCNYNFIYGIISDNKIKIQEADIIYICKSTFCFIEVIKQIYFKVDYVIHIKNLDLINFDTLINCNFNDNKITASNDTENIYCRIIPHDLINTLDINYYSHSSAYINKNFDIINCTYNDTKNINFYISGNKLKSVNILNKIKNEELISIIMTCYNSEFTIEDSIISILNQTYTNFEFIIIDDGSNDNTNTIIKKYSLKDKRIKFFTLPNN